MDRSLLFVLILCKDQFYPFAQNTLRLLQHKLQTIAVRQDDIGLRNIAMRCMNKLTDGRTALCTAIQDDHCPFVLQLLSLFLICCNRQHRHRNQC